MITPYVYSFKDLVGAIAHPNLGAYTFDGAGIGKLSIIMDTDKSSHLVGAEGTVMVSKISGDNGRIVIDVQQVSNIDKYLLAAYNYLKIADGSQWAQMGATLRDVAGGMSHILTGMSFLKLPDRPREAQGQNVSWTILFADGQHIPA